MHLPLTWTGGPLEYSGIRGHLLIAKVVRDYDGTFSLYDQRETDVGLGPLKAVGVPLDEAKRRAEEL